MKKNIVIIALLLIIGVFGIYYFMCNDKDKSYTYNDIAGLYTYDESIKFEDETFTASYQLYLYEDGTFIYTRAMNAISGNLGNYIIVDDEIHLNYLFSSGSDVALSVMSGNKVLKINGDNSLTETDADSKEIKFVKVSKDKENEYLKYNDFSNMLKTYSLINEYSE